MTNATSGTCHTPNMPMSRLGEHELDVTTPRWEGSGTLRSFHGFVLRLRGCSDIRSRAFVATTGEKDSRKQFQPLSDSLSKIPADLSSKDDRREIALPPRRSHQVFLLSRPLPMRQHTHTQALCSAPKAASAGMTLASTSRYPSRCAVQQTSR